MHLVPLLLLLLPTASADPAGARPVALDPGALARPATGPQDGGEDPEAPVGEAIEAGVVAAEAEGPGPGLTVSRGEGRHPLFVPEDERLEYQVLLSVGSLIDAEVGDFVLSSGVEPFRKGLPRAGVRAVEASDQRVGWVRASGSGGYLGYSVDHAFESRYLPQAWPRLVHREVEAGTKSRTRELMYGRKGDGTRSWFRTDHHCTGCERREHWVEASLFSSAGHCSDCGRGEHRIWGESCEQEVPEGAVDLMGGIHLARALVREELEELAFPLLQKEEYWNVTLVRGERREVSVPAGRFLAQEVKLVPEAEDGSGPRPKLSGLFGREGSLSLWLEAATGVPVLVTGVVPAGPLELGVSIRLVRHRGAPPAFASL